MRIATAARCRASTATARQRAELLAKHVRQGAARRRSGSSSAIWDPHWKMNPGKVIDPYRLDEHLKLGTDYNPPRPADARLPIREDKRRLRPRRAAVRRASASAASPTPTR